MTPRADAWLVDLLAPDHFWDDEACRAALSEEEAARAARFRDPAAGRTYARSRACVRRVLAHVLGEAPADVRVEVPPDGRPVLPDHPDTAVSWSRSGGVLLLAVREGAPIGADVEVVRPVRSPARVLRTVYPHVAPLGELADPETFLSAWTLLEASVKATGRGLARGARDVRLLRPPGARRCVLGGIRGTGTAPWSARIHRFAAPRPSVHVLTAVVTRGSAVPVRMHAWQLPGALRQESTATLGRLENAPC